MYLYIFEYLDADTGTETGSAGFVYFVLKLIITHAHSHTVAHTHTLALIDSPTGKTHSNRKSAAARSTPFP